MDDRFEHLIAASVPTCKFPVDDRLCGEPAPYLTEEIGYGDLRGQLETCRTHIRQIDANMLALLAHAVPSSQVSGIENTPTLAAGAEPLDIEPQQQHPHFEWRPAQSGPVTIASREDRARMLTARINGQPEPEPEFDPNDPRIVAGTHYYCATVVNGRQCGTVFVRSGVTQEGNKHRRPAYTLKLLPEGRFQCTREDHIAAGCVRSFDTATGRAAHYKSTIIPPFTSTHQAPVDAIPTQRPATGDVHMTAERLL